MIYNRLLSKYFPSPGKQRLFFLFKWRKVPATQYPSTPFGLGFYLITWAGFCSHIYCPLSLQPWLEPAANFQAAVSDYLMHRSNLLAELHLEWNKNGSNSLSIKVNTLLLLPAYVFACSALFFQLFQAYEIPITGCAETGRRLEEQLPVYMTPHLTPAPTFKWILLGKRPEAERSSGALSPNILPLIEWVIGAE